MESKIPSISGLATTSELTAVENKTPAQSKKKKQIITQKLVTLKKNSLIIIRVQQANCRKFCCKIKTSSFSNKDRF